MRSLAGAPDECKRGDCRRGGHHGKGESFEEENQERLALPLSKDGSEQSDLMEPQERRPDETSWSGLQAE